LCDCGNHHEASVSSLNTGSPRSCGCASHPSGKDNTSYKHGLSHTKEYRTDNTLRTLYNIGLSDYNVLLKEQKGKCKICGKEQQGDRALSVDHDHITGEIRGLLCRNCNSVIGFCKEDVIILERVIDYLLENGKMLR